MQNAVIYARVSTEKQVTNGSGLDSQIHRCKQMCDQKNYEVKQVFQDEGVSGKVQQRPAIKELLVYLSKNSNTIVVIDEQKRLARDVEVYLYLSKAINQLDCTIEYLNNKFDNTPESRFIELILAGSAQLEREQNARQVIQKMKAQLECGKYCLALPKGYVKIKKEIHKVEPYSSIITAMFESFISRQLTSIEDCRRFLEAGGIKCTKSTARRLINTCLYAGYYEFEKWEIPLTRMKNIPPIISFEMWTKAQELIKSPIREKRNDFYLRGFVKCEECDKCLTGAYSTSKSGAKYGYYFCQTRKCSLRRKNVSKSLLEDSFVDLLKSLEIADARFYKMAKMVWLDSVMKLKESWLKNKIVLKDRAVLIDRDIQNLVNRVAKTGSDTIAETFEKRINDLEKDKIIILEKIKLSEDNDLTRAGEMFDQVIEDHKSVSNTWYNSDMQGKSMLFNRIFEDKLVWSLKGMYRTPRLCLFYQQKSTPEGTKNYMVDISNHLLNIIEGIKATLYMSEHTQESY